MPDEVRIAGTPCTVKVRNPWAVLALTFVTLGIYSLFWWYFINREMRDLGRARAIDGLGERPGVSTLAFSGLAVFTLYVSLVWTVATTTRRVQRTQEVAGHTGRLNGWLSAALWIFTLSIGGIVYTQGELNKAWKAQEAEPKDLDKANADADVARQTLAPQLSVEDPEEWPAEHPVLWDTITRRAYMKRYGKQPGA